MGDVDINQQLFSDRLAHFYSVWKADKRSGDALFGGVGSILCIVGKSDDSQQYTKSSAIHYWLLGYEFPATIFLFTTSTMYAVTTVKKAKHLQSLKGGKIPLEILITHKDPEQKAKTFERCVEAIKNAGNKLGVVASDHPTGPFIDEWKQASEALFKDVQEVDISPALSQTFAIKDEAELRAMRNASRACSGIMSEYFVDEMQGILDAEKKTSHQELSKRIEDKIDDDKFFAKLKNAPSDLKPDQIDWAYTPCVQSGGKFNIKGHVEPDANNLHPGVIVADFGLRYKSYSSIVARTYLVDPSKSQESNYKLLATVHETTLKEVRDGATVKDIYNRALGMIKAKKPELEQRFLKSVGSAIGLELRDSNFLLNGKNTRSLKDGMTLCVTTGFSDIPNPGAKNSKDATYSLVISDTVRVTRNDAAVFTKDATSDPELISFYFNEPEEVAPKKETKKESRPATVAARNITKTKLRSERPMKIDETAEARRREHQKELAAKRQKAGLERFAGATGDQNGVDQKKFKRFESYKREDQLPSKIKDLAIFVDVKASTIVLPIMGRPVPFHINTIKNASKSDEGEYAYLRINFLSPGQGVGRKDDQPFEDASAHFVRSLTFRSKDVERMATIAQQITDVRKETVRREQEKKEMEDVVEQDKLVEIRNRRPARLNDVFLRPALDGKRVAGEVEIHQNGLRYNNPLRGEKIDVLFSNMKHLFFQPCQGELIVLIHVHLENPIMIGKRKTKDVQFYREATEMQFDETGNRKRKHRMGDDDEFEAEQEERRRRAALDREFKAFAEKISEAVTRDDNRLDVDIPFRELGFNGVPHRSSVLVSPTTECLVQLTEPPFMVVTLDEIEIAHLERVQFGLKNFDLVLVLKDFTKPPIHINTIPVENLESVKDWLDSVNIPFSEGPLNLNWTTIMKTVVADPHQFFIDGGWSFLSTESDDENESEEEEESAFEVSDEDLGSDESSEEESEFDDEASAEASDDASALSEESGEDWDELEKKAKKKDREIGMDDEDRDRGKKRKR